MTLSANRQAILSLFVALGFAYSQADAQQPAPLRETVVTALGVRWSETPTALLVESVDPQSEAARIGLKAGDALVSINGQEVTTSEALAAALKKLAPGDALRVQFIRGNETFAKTMAMPDTRLNFYGAMVQFGADDRVQVGDVVPDSLAEKAGLKKGDLIISVAGHKTASPEDLSQLLTQLEAVKSVEPIEVKVRRPRETSTLTFAIERVPVVKTTAPAVVVPLPAETVVAQPAALALGMTVGVRANKVVVVKTLENGPAAVAGIQPGDILVSIGQKPIDSFDAVKAAIAGARPGDEIALAVQRRDKSGIYRIKAVKMPPDTVDLVLDTQAVPGGVVSAAVVPAEPADQTNLSTEVRLLRARVEQLEQIVKELSRRIEPQPRPLR